MRNMVIVSGDNPGMRTGPAKPPEGYDDEEYSEDVTFHSK